MNDYELWEHLSQYGQLSARWWYDIAVLPISMLAGFTFLLMWFALRRQPQLPMMFFWLLLASVPIVLMLPSLYVHLGVGRALAWVGFPTGATAQAVGRETTLVAGQYLSQLARLGMVGLALTVVMLFASSMLGGYAPQMVQNISRTITAAMTRAFGKRRATRSAASAPFGTVKVTKGQQAGMQWPITSGAVIGKKEAAMLLTDVIVSRRHAQFEVRGDVAHVMDMGSANGTFLGRHGTTQDVETQPLALQNGDKLYLGHPDEPESVELTFLHMALGSI